MAALPRFLLDRLIRRKARLHRTPLDRYAVRIARTVKEHRDAFRLVHVAYIYQGIVDVGDRTEMRITEQHVLPESTVFVAYEGEQIVGTMTVTLDSPAGLPIEHDYAQEIGELRAAGHRLVEYGSLAVVKRCWRSGVTHLLANAAHFFARRTLGATHCVIGVNPRAVPLYRALYNFETIGAPRQHASLAAPVQGLVQDMVAARSFVTRHFRKPMTTGLYPVEHFCEVLPPCIDVPVFPSLAALVRWKLPRGVFRELFIERSDRVATLGAEVRQQLSSWRSIRTCAPPLRAVAQAHGAA